jgi:hypothetical protein
MINEGSGRNAFQRGLFAATADIVLTHPLWSIKTLLQSGLTRPEIGALLLKRPRLLYQGVLPNAASMLPINTFRVFVHDRFQPYFTWDRTHCLAPLCSGAMSGVLASPIELIRTTQLQYSMRFPSCAMSFSQAAQQVLHRGGLGMMLSAGLPSIACRDALYTMGFLAWAPMAQQYAQSRWGQDTVVDLGAYLVTGMSISLLNHPFDTIKTWQQTQAAQHVLDQEKISRKSMTTSLLRCLKQSSWRSLSLGYWPRSMRFALGLAVKAQVLASFPVAASVFTVSNPDKEDGACGSDRPFSP